MKTLGILIGAALVLATAAHDARATGTGGFDTTCPGIASTLQMDFKSCQYNASQKTGAERQKHWKWCKFQHKNAANFIRLCHKFSGRCYRGRVHWSFTFYDFLPERPYDPPGIPASFPGSATTAYGGMNCGSAPDGWLPPGEAREAREREAREAREREEREAREREEREAREREEREAREREAAEPPAPAVVLEPKCEGMPTSQYPGNIVQCWKQVSGKRCRLWDDLYNHDQQVTWSGACAGGVAVGEGTTVWTSNRVRSEMTGTYVNGKRHGRWVAREKSIHVASCSVSEYSMGKYVTGRRKDC